MVQFITHYNERYSYLDSVRIVLEGGCRWIQLRMKDSSPEEILPIAEKALAMCREHNATFIIDDHVELAKQIKADGVHLGKLDMPIAEARRILGKDFLIGGTANTFEDILEHHEEEPFTRIGFGRLSSHHLANERSGHPPPYSCHWRYHPKRYSFVNGNRYHGDCTERKYSSS